MDKRLTVQPRIVFTDQDLVGVQLPHKDPLVVILRVANYDIKRILIDNGSTVNVIFLFTLRRMEFDLRRMEPTRTNLSRFSEEIFCPKNLKKWSW